MRHDQDRYQGYDERPGYGAGVGAAWAALTMRTAAASAFLVCLCIILGVALASPTVTLSVTIVPAAGAGFIACDIGPPYTRPIPAGAQAAGFTHCVANYDFTNSAFLNTSNWLTSAKGTTCFSSTPVLWVVDPGNGIEAPCSRYQLVDDTANGGGGQVLKVSFLSTDSYSMTRLNTVSNQNFPNPAGLKLYSGFYTEETFRIDQSYLANTSCPPGGSQPCIYFDYWTIPYACSVCNGADLELDFIEMYAQQGPPNNGAPDAGGGSHPGNDAVAFFNPGPYTSGQFANGYNTIGGLVSVASGQSPNLSNCWYVNGTKQKCVAVTTVAANITEPRYQIFLADVGPQQTGLVPQINQAVYIKQTTVWACSNYATSPCYSSLVTN